jgi:cell division protease FtsH
MSDNNDKRNKGRRPNPDDKFEWKKAARTVSFWILIFLASIVIAQAFNFGEQREVKIPYTEYRQLLEAGQVESGYIIESEFHGSYRVDAMNPDSEKIHFETILPFIENWMLEEWDELGVTYEFREKATNLLGYFFTAIFPWLFLIGLWIFFMRRMQGGGPKGVFSFGKSRAKLLTENKPKVTFADVAGTDEAKEELQEIIEFLKDPKKFQKLGGRIPRGALLLGPPGTGKTLLARAVAGEAAVPFFSMSGADFVEMFVGVGASRVRDLFEQGKKNAPCIIFIDEIDAVGRQRGAGLGGGHDEREQTLNQLLVEMDGFESNEGVILLAATNRPDVLDPALMRPGRFDRQIVVDRPDVRGREGILKVHTKKIPLNNDVDLKVLAKGTPGLAGAELANLANEAALLAAKRNSSNVTMEDLEHAKDKVMMGVERKSLLISEDEKKTTAYHEAGHVLVSKLIPGADPVHKVTIIPRGRALGLTHYLPIDEKHNYSKQYLEALLTHLLGGRAAEQLVFKQQTTGAGNDIERATEIARKMVCEWGMSDKLGPLTFGKKEEEIFLGREIAKHRDYSEQTAVEIDEEVRRIVTDAAERAKTVLSDNLETLNSIAETLLEREILDGEDIDRLMRGESLEDPAKRKAKKPRKMRAKAARTKKKKDSTDQSPEGGEEPSPATA